jgi:peptide/nickel transport system permease protein
MQTTTRAAAALLVLACVWAPAWADATDPARLESGFARHLAPFLLKRLATLLITLAVASAVVFAVLELLPGNAAEVILGDTATPESLAALQAKLGLDRPPLQRYRTGWRPAARRDGAQHQLRHAHGRADRRAPAGDAAAGRDGDGADRGAGAGPGALRRVAPQPLGDVGVMAASQLGIAIPNFWFAILLILLFAVQLQWVSAGGFPGWTEDDGGGLWEGLQGLMLPAVALALVQAAILARVTRSAVLEVMREDFVRTARAKGLSRARRCGATCCATR